MRHPPAPFPGRNFRLQSDLPTPEALWCAQMWSRLERSYKSEVHFIYHVGSAQQVGHDSLMAHFNSIYQGTLGGGCPPEPGSRPSTWPDNGSTGTWGKWFPQELLVDDVETYIVKSQRTMRRKAMPMWKRKITTSRSKQRSASNSCEGSEVSSDSVTVIPDSEYTGSSGGSDDGIDD
eukprot:TRINITY_DN32144_c0_g1_i1.p1 TRINITY_DN32144_c0_g1~~TRINITY_DN32144_c0_g1_i1.p1  ORF type:complete len:177 (+),score=18.10 TRINITY_DN32144_c0_g1_i1:62-592(+)